MSWTLVYVFLAIALVTALVVFMLSARLGDEPRPALQRVGLSLAAGVAWPMVLLGLLELSSVAMYVKVKKNDAQGNRVEVLV